MRFLFIFLMLFNFGLVNEAAPNQKQSMESLIYQIITLEDDENFLKASQKNEPVLKVLGEGSVPQLESTSFDAIDELEKYFKGRVSEDYLDKFLINSGILERYEAIQVTGVHYEITHLKLKEGTSSEAQINYVCEVSYRKMLGNTILESFQQKLMISLNAQTQKIESYKILSTNIE